MNCYRVKSLGGRKCWYLAAGLLGAMLLPWVGSVAQSSSSPLMERARAAEKSGDLPSAERAYQQALELEPENAEALKRLGVVEQTELKFNESIHHFNMVLSRDEHYPEANFFLGVSYLGLNNFPRRFTAFRQNCAHKSPTRGAAIIWEWLTNRSGKSMSH